jgi:hypothetical protein
MRPYCPALRNTRLAALAWLAIVPATFPAAASDPGIDLDLRPITARSAPWQQPMAAAGDRDAIPRGVDGIGATVDADRLSGLRGGETSVDNRILVDGRVSDNVAEKIVSGANAVGGGGFGNANGINTVIQNTGSNVLIQNAMIVNVQFNDPSP